MVHNFLVIMFILHIVGDYYLQSDKIAYNKKNKVGPLLLHCLVYAVVAYIIIIPVWSLQVVIYTGLVVAVHFVIDMLKFIFYKTTKKFMSHMAYKDFWQTKGKVVYIVDQVLHVISIFIISIIFVEQVGSLLRWGIFDYSDDINNMLLRYGLMVLLIFKPVNITFRQLFIHTKPEEERSTDENNAGQLIGNMERLLILVLLALGQFTAIGLVFTAKSITRYDKISKEKAFAEYYLLGTLFSMLATLVLYLLIIKL